MSAVVANAASGTTVGLNYYGLIAGGQVWRENIIVPTGAQYQDPGRYASLTWTSPQIKSDGLVGWSQWQMIRLLLTLKNPCALTVTIAYDYGGAAPQVFTQSAAQLIGQLAPGLPQILLQIRPANQRAATMQITISDSADTGTTTGQGFLLEDLRIDYGTEPGGYRAPTVQQG